MRKIVYLIISFAIIGLTSCHSRHNMPTYPEKPEQQENIGDHSKDEKENAPEDGNDDKPEEGNEQPPEDNSNKSPDDDRANDPKEGNSDESKDENSSPSDHDIVRRLYAQWKDSERIEQIITIDFDQLFIDSKGFTLTPAEISEFVTFNATAINSTTPYTLKDDDLQKLKLTNFKYKPGYITFDATYGTQNYIKGLSLNFSREKYLMARIKPKEKIDLYMQGVAEWPGLFMAELFDYDPNRYDIIPESLSANSRSLDITISVGVHNHEHPIAILAYTIDGFTPMEELSKRLTIGGGSGFAETFYNYYEKANHDLTIVNKYAAQWSKLLQFMVDHHGDKIALVWNETNTAPKQRVLEPDTSIKRHRDLYLIEPRFIIDEVIKNGDTLQLKVKLAYANNTEIRDAIFPLSITIPKNRSSSSSQQLY